jgi:flagellar assembly protein FliH
MNEPGKPLKNYSIDRFEALSANAGSDGGEFVSLQVANQTASEFIPITISVENQSSVFGDEHSLKTAQERANLLEQDAYEKGFAQGERDGLELGEKKSEKIIEKMESLFTELTHLKDAMIKQYEKEILDLIFAIARKIVHCQTRSDEGVVRNTILKALKLAAQKGKIIVRVNPEDYDVVEKIRPELIKEFKDVKSIMITSDHSISRGGCFLETTGGDIDATVEAQLEKIYHSLEQTFLGNECT